MLDFDKIMPREDAVITCINCSLDINLCNCDKEGPTDNQQLRLGAVLGVRPFVIKSLWDVFDENDLIDDLLEISNSPDDSINPDQERVISFANYIVSKEMPMESYKSRSVIDSFVNLFSKLDLNADAAKRFMLLAYDEYYPS